MQRLLQIFIVCAVSASGIAFAGSQIAELSPGQGFRVTLFSNWEGPDLYVRYDQNYEPLRAYRSAYTRVFPFPEEGVIALYAKVDLENNKESYQPIFQVQVPETIAEPMLLLFWDANNQRAGGKIIEFSPGKFPYGSYQIVNISDSPLYGYIGAKENLYTCKERGGTYISDFRFKQGDKIPIKSYIRQESASYSVVFSTLTIHREKKRVILFLIGKRNNEGRLIYHSQSLVDYNRID